MISDVSLRICIRYHRRRGCRGLSARRKVGSAAVPPPPPGAPPPGPPSGFPTPPPASPLRSVLRAWAPPVAARYRHRFGAEPRRPSRRLRSFGTHPERGGLRSAQSGLCGGCCVFPSGASLLHRGNPIPHLKLSLNSGVSASLPRRRSGRQPGYSPFLLQRVNDKK